MNESNVPKLDLETDAFLKELRQNNAPELSKQPVSEARGLLKKLQLETNLPASFKTKNKINVITQSVPGPGGGIPLKVYSPREPATRVLRPLVVFYHGGGWMFGDVEAYEDTIKYMCEKSGANFISVDYRLAPEYRFPAAVIDCYAALCWASNMALSLGSDPSKLCVAGDSAGGNLAAVVSHISKREKGPKIARQILLYPVLEAPMSGNSSRELFGGGEFVLSNSELDYFISAYLSRPEEQEDYRFSPMLAGDFAELPDALIIAAECDILCEEGQRYAEALNSVGVSVEYKMYKGTIHGFITFAGRISLGLDAMDYTARYISSLGA